MNNQTRKLLKSYPSDITELDISNKNISGVLSLRRFPNLQKLNCSNNKITKIIHWPWELNSIDCSNNQICYLNNINVYRLIFFKFDSNPLVSFRYHFNDVINEYPNTLKYLTLEHYFNQSIDNLPNSIIELNIDGEFNQPINCLPNQLVKLKIYMYFNQPINNLPNTLEELELGWGFNQPINYLPSSLKKLHIEGVFNQPIDLLPNSIIELNFHNSGFNQPINNLPKSIQKLSIWGKFNQPVNCLPDSINELSLKGDFSQPIDNLPDSITNLTLNVSTKSKPKLNFTNFKIDTPKLMPKINKLPKSIQNIYFDYNNSNLLHLIPENYHNIIKINKKKNVTYEYNST